MKTDRELELEEEVRLMALDNILLESMCAQYRGFLLKMSKHMKVPANVRDEFELTINQVDRFHKNGHKSLRGLKDATGNPIKGV